MKNKPQLFWTEEFKIRAYEVEPHGRVTMQSIFNYLQEIAGNHASELGVAVDELIKQNLTWVLSRVHLQIHDYPFWRQKMTIETWPSDRDSFYALRDFRLLNEQSEVIGLATSSWMLIDIKLRKPVAMPSFIDDLKNTEKGRALPDSFGKLPKLKRVDAERAFNVRLSDLDINQHVNSVNFLEWGLECIPENIRKKYQLSDLEVTYRAESNYGDRVISQCQVEEDQNSCRIIHRLQKEADNRELTRILTNWKKIV